MKRKPVTEAQRQQRIEINRRGGRRVHKLDALAQVLRDLRWKFRARHIGSFEWTCPQCGFMNRTRLNRTDWTVLCGANTCRRLYGTGSVLYLLPVGRKTPPADIVIPATNMREVFPEGEVLTWASGNDVNQIRVAGGEEWPEGD